MLISRPTTQYERDGLDERQIVIAHGLHHQIADAGIGEDHLDQQRAAEQKAELDADQREGRQRRVLERVADAG